MERKSDFKLLVVDDDELILESFPLAVPDNWQFTGHSDFRTIPEGSFDAAFVDMHLEGEEREPHGLKVIEMLAKKDPRLEIIAISGDLDRHLMEQCLKNGASRYLAKPLSTAEVKLLLEKIEALHLLRDAERRSTLGKERWLGESEAALQVQRQIAELKGEGGPILLEGESGTGKEVAAQWIHAQEKRGPFVTVNVAALPESLFESEIFGHVKGAFTGADQNKMGLAEAAHNGDLFLDEIEALPMALQAKLLRFLESGEIRRVGDKKEIKVNVRVIAATNQNLSDKVEKGEFREDLLWRLSGKKIKLPPLRERKSDIKALSLKFLSEQKTFRNKSFTDDAIEVMRQYEWPGNVRELKRVCEQLSLTSPLPIIRAEDLKNIIDPKKTVDIESQDINIHLGLNQLMQAFEKKVIEEGLHQNKDIDELSKILKISRSSLYKKVKDHEIEIRG